RRLDREALLEPGVPAHVKTLGPELGHTAGNHVLDRRRLDSRPLHHRAVGGSEELIGMRVLVVALFQVPSTDRCPSRLNDHNLPTTIRRHALLLCLPRVSNWERA